MNDFLTYISDQLKAALDIDIDYKSYPGSSREFCVFDYEIFNKTFDRIEGQVIIEVNSLSKFDLLDYVNTIRLALDNKTYATGNSGANFNFVTVNDISRIETLDHARQLIFEFKLYIKEA